MMLIQHWLPNTQSRVQQAYWLILESNEKATLNINMPYWLLRIKSTKPPPVLANNHPHIYKCVNVCIQFYGVFSSKTDKQENSWMLGT